MRAATVSAPDYAGHSAAPFSAANTIQAIIVSAQCGLLKDFAAFVAVGAFVAAVALCLPQ